MISRRFLIVIPAATYILSYLYLAYYHGKVWLFDTVTHESGRHTLLEEIFYASHFLGHVPVHTMAALVFTGTYLCMTIAESKGFERKTMWVLLILLLGLLVFSLFVGAGVFGYEDMSAFVMQRKQSESVYGQGGSWNLHLPSSMVLFLLVPVYIYIFKRTFGGELATNRGGLLYIGVGLLLLVGLTAIVNKDAPAAVMTVWADGRYLGHSVRELVTFSLTYFPIPLYFLLGRQGNRPERVSENKGLRTLVVVLAVLLAAAILYQSYIPLMEGIGQLAQKPAFAKGGSLTIGYLLASHFFEHFLDTIYFALVFLLLWGLAKRKELRTEVA